MSLLSVISADYEGARLHSQISVAAMTSALGFSPFDCLVGRLHSRDVRGSNRFQTGGEFAWLVGKKPVSCAIARLRTIQDDEKLARCGPEKLACQQGCQRLLLGHSPGWRDE